MKLRYMKPSDFAETYKLWQIAGLKLKAFATEKREALAMIAKNESACLVMEDKRKIVGSVFGVYNGRRGWIYHLVVHPKYQRKGYGSMLLKKSERALKKMGAERVLLGVWMKDMDILPFYQKRGYFIIDDSIFLVKDLE